MNEYCVKLNEYEIANLISALRAVVGFEHADANPYARLKSPLNVLQSGDWTTQVLNKLTGVCPASEVTANVEPETYAALARAEAAHFHSNAVGRLP